MKASRVVRLGVNLREDRWEFEHVIRNGIGDEIWFDMVDLQR